MTYLQFLLIVHVLGAIIGFGSTFAFAELLIDREEDRTLRAVLVGMLRESAQ